MKVIEYDLYLRPWDSDNDEDWQLHSSYPKDAHGLAKASKDCYENHQKQWSKSCWWKYKVEKVTRKKEFVIYYKERDGRMLPMVAYDTAEEAAGVLDEKIKELGHSYYDHPYEIKEVSE